MRCVIALGRALRPNRCIGARRKRGLRRLVRREGYLGVAYLFTAVAAAEMVHATSFARMLARLGADVPPAPKPEVKAGTTRANLVQGAQGEIDSVDEKTGRHFVCQICGATTNAIPAGLCTVCRQPATRYRLIGPPAA